MPHIPDAEVRHPKTVITCHAIPALSTTLAIQTEAHPPYVFATYHAYQNGVHEGVPRSIRGASDMLVIRSEQALRLFEFAIRDVGAVATSTGGVE